MGVEVRQPRSFRTTALVSGITEDCLPSPFLAAEPDLLRRSRSAAGAFDACHVGYSSCSQGKLTEKQPRCRKTAFCALPHGGSCGQAGPSKRAFSVRQSCLEFDEISLSHSEYPFLIAFKYGSCPNNRISFDHPAGWGFSPPLLILIRSRKLTPHVPNLWDLLELTPCLAPTTLESLKP